MARAFVVCLILTFTYTVPASAATGTVTGTVTRSDTAAAVVGGSAVLCTASYDCSYASTDASGMFTFTVDPGTYYLFTNNGQGLIDEVYDNIQCPGLCDLGSAFNSATPIVVTSGGTVSGRDFALDVGATITGTIVNSSTSAAASSVAVYVYTIRSSDGALLLAGYGSTNAAGVYTASGLQSGTYYARTYNEAGLVNEVYDNIQCTGNCTATQIRAGTPISATVGATTANIDFALDAGGSVTGTIRDSATSAALQDIYVYIATVTSSGGLTAAASGYTDASGAYTVSGLPSGNYYAYTWNYQGYINELFDNVQCAGSCSSAAGGTLVPVTAGATTSGKDFALDRGGEITGVVTRADTSTPLTGVSVYAYARASDGTAKFVSSDITDTSGAYSVGGLVTGTYYLHTTNDAGFLNEIFDDIQCIGSCSSSTAVASGTGIDVTVNTTVSGKNFALELGGSISGTVLSSAGSTPIADAYVYVYTHDADGNLVYVAAVPTTASGEYIAQGLPAGAYYAFTSVAGYRNEIYDGPSCLGSCSAYTAAAVGTPISVTTGNTTSGIQFLLDRAGGISGTVRNAVTSAPMEGVYVYAYRDVGDGYPNYVSSGLTDSSGAYEIWGLPTGDYYVASGANGFQNQVFTGVSCPRFCSTEFVSAHATPVAVVTGAATGGKNFALTPATGRITGVITNAATSEPAQGVYVYVYVRSGVEYAYVASGYSDASGVYEIQNLPSGTYYAVSASYGKYLDEIYPDIPCLTTCDYGVGAVLAGTPIVLGADPVTVNFGLQPFPESLPPGPPDSLSTRITGGSVVFRWYQPWMWGWDTVTDYVLEAGLSPGAPLLTIPVNGLTYTASGVPPGRYYVRVRARNSAGVGPASNEIEVQVNADGSGAPDPPTSLLIYTEGSMLHASWAPATTGGVATDFVLEAGTGPGSSNLGTLAVGSTPVFESSVLPPPGVYFVRVRARNALSMSRPSDEVMVVVGGAPAPPNPPGNIGIAVDTSRRVLIGWTPPGGSVTGYVLEIGSSEKRSDLGVFTLGATPTFVLREGVPPGVYYIRLRSVNAQGAGVASYDTLLVVP